VCVCAVVHGHTHPFARGAAHHQKDSNYLFLAALKYPISQQSRLNRARRKNTSWSLFLCARAPSCGRHGFPTATMAARPTAIGDTTRTWRDGGGRSGLAALSPASGVAVGVVELQGAQQQGEEKGAAVNSEIGRRSTTALPIATRIGAMCTSVVTRSRHARLFAGSSSAEGPTNREEGQSELGLRRESATEKKQIAYVI